MFPIEKEIPMPLSSKGQKGKSKYPLKRMNVGDSFFIPEDKRNPKDKKMTSLYTIASKIGIKIAIRKTNSPNGLRVWRVK